MTYYLFNKQDGTQGIGEYQSDISEDIIFKGTKEEFESLGFNESQVGGFELINNKLTFNQTLYENAQKAKLPIANGSDLVKFMETNLANYLGDIGGLEMMSKLATVRSFLQSAISNSLSQERLQNCLIYIQQNKEKLEITDNELTQINMLIESWVGTVRFTV